jgi:hypothetical protein
MRFGTFVRCSGIARGLRNTQINRAIRSSGMIDQPWSAGTWLLMILAAAFPPLGIILIIVALCSGRKKHTTTRETFRNVLEQPSSALEVNAAQQEAEEKARRVHNAEIARQAAVRAIKTAEQQSAWMPRQQEYIAAVQQPAFRPTDAPSEEARQIRNAALVSEAIQRAIRAVEELARQRKVTKDS